MKRYAPAFAALASALLLAAGILAGQHSMILSYAVVVCLSCIGIG
jgi:hypothetical protein